MSDALSGPAAMTGRRAVMVFLPFAWAYFLSALLRAVTATLAPIFSVELAIGAAELGLLAGAFFLGFALMQLPLGQALDRFGPRRVLLALLLVATGGCVAFALASGLPGLLLARAAIGLGVSACLMAPLTCYRLLFSPADQMRANSWMLMTGSLGMMASTLPVHWLLPLVGWRGLFWVLAGLLSLAWLVLALSAPRDRANPAPAAAVAVGYRDIVRHPMFVRMAPLAFFVYGGMIAVQALWAGPWLTRVARWSAEDAAAGLFAINGCMLVAFLTWGTVLPRLTRRRWDAERLIAFGVPLSLVALAAIVAAGPLAGAAAWAIWCVCSTFVSLSQPAVGQAFATSAAGRALSAFNLVIFSGVFALQWGIGWCIDLLLKRGHSEVEAYRWTFAIFGLCCLAAYGWFVAGRQRGHHNRR